jgi:integrase
VAARRAFGQIQRLPSKRYRARYMGPDGVRHNAPRTFDARIDAEAWLTDERRLLVAGTWTPPATRANPSVTRRAHTLGGYADAWLADRPLKPRTREHYAALIRNQLAPLLDEPVADLTPAVVRAWHSALDPTRPTLRAHAYALLRAILATAVHDGLLPQNPCYLRGAGNAKRAHKVEPATLAQLEALVDAMPPRYRVMVLLAAWCGLRFGELTELRRSDLDLNNGIVRVRRGVVRVDGRVEVGTPKTAAGIRDVAIPPHLLPAVREHIAEHAAFGRDGLLFPAATNPTEHLAPSALYRVFYPARKAAGRPDLRWHDLRHTGAVLAASTGATLAELMARLGHSTPGAALRYQHAAQGRDAAIAAKLSQLAENR